MKLLKSKKSGRYVGMLDTGFWWTPDVEKAHRFSDEEIDYALTYLPADCYPVLIPTTIEDEG